jgi:hypothetical protein
MAQYGDKRDYPKIDIYVFSESLKRWQYVSSTTWSRTCREAADRLAALHPNLSRSNIRARFDKRG